MEETPYIRPSIPIEEITIENICGNSTQPPIGDWAPRRADIDRILNLAEAVTEKEKPVILDIGCGSGLLAYLLAETGRCQVIGIDPENDGSQTYTHQNLTLEKGDVGSAVKKYQSAVDLVLNSYMPEGKNLTPAIRRIGAQAIVYVKDVNGLTGVDIQALSYQYKIPAYELRSDYDLKDRVSYMPGKEYKHFCEWKIPNQEEIRLIALDLKDGLGRHRHYTISDVRIEFQLRRDCQLNDRPGKCSGPKYPWEKELDKYHYLVGDIKYNDDEPGEI